MPLAVDQSGSGIPLVFLHAFPLDRRMWSPQSKFSRNYRFIAPDLPGFGASPLGSSAPSMESMARDVITTLDQLGAREPAVFVGLSMGGYVLFQIARLFPQRLRAAAFMATRVGADSPEAREKRFQNVALVEKEGVGALVERMVPALLGETTRNERPDAVQTVKSIMSDQAAAGVTAALKAMAARPDLSTVLEGLNCPALLVAGAEDAVIKADEMDSMSKRLRVKEFHVVEKAGHLLNIERPEVLNDLLSHFLKRRVL